MPELLYSLAHWEWLSFIGPDTGWLTYKPRSANALEHTVAVSRQVDADLPL